MSVINITKENFEAEVLNSKETVLIDFWAAWCGPCKMLTPIIEEVAAETKDAKVCKLNIDEQMELASQYGIMSIPTLLVFKDGQIVKKEVGLRGKEEILDMLK